jgi:hypothetical protein
MILLFPFFYGYEICKERGSEREALANKRERERKEETKERRK